jgi:hypothetical protein
VKSAAGVKRIAAVANPGGGVPCRGKAPLLIHTIDSATLDTRFEIAVHVSKSG